MTTETYEILAIKYGEFANRRRFESFIAADDHDGPHPIDYFVWLIRNANRSILVDCGFEKNVTHCRLKQSVVRQRRAASLSNPMLWLCSPEISRNSSNSGRMSSRRSSALYSEAKAKNCGFSTKRKGFSPYRSRAICRRCQAPLLPIPV